MKDFPIAADPVSTVKHSDFLQLATFSQWQIVTWLESDSSRKIWGLETCLTNTDERLDLTLTWLNLRLDSDLTQITGTSWLFFLSLFFCAYWDIGRWQTWQSGTVVDRIRGGEAEWWELWKSSNLDSKIDHPPSSVYHVYGYEEYTNANFLWLVWP